MILTVEIEVTGPMDSTGYDGLVEMLAAAESPIRMIVPMVQAHDPELGVEVTMVDEDGETHLNDSSLARGVDPSMGRTG